MQGVKLLHALLIGALIVVFLPRPVLAQDEFESREFLVDVHPNLRIPGLSAGERVLMFDRPVQIPGARLSAGPYIFRMVSPGLLQVADTSRQKIYATFFVIPTYRNDRNDSGLDRIKFQNTGEDESLRIVAWYTPDGNGYEFPYQKPKRKSLDRRER
jgi:hypothetical protein